MPSKSLPSRPSLDHLKYQARDLLHAFHAKDPEALQRVRAVHPKVAEAALESAKPAGTASPPANVPQFALADAQLVIAREYGFDSWPKLKRHVESLTEKEANDPATSSAMKEALDEFVARFLEYACPDHHVRGGYDLRIARHAAVRLLKQRPEIARHNLFTAVVCGELAEVQRRLAERPTAAREKYSAPGPDRSGPGSENDVLKDNGPKRWEPLLFLCFARLSTAVAEANAVAIARALLDHGADPNAYFMAGDSRYTSLVGVIGEGEENRSPHPHRDALVPLLLERGAQPYDMQVVYNIHFHGKILWFMKLMYEHSVRRGRQSDWQDPNWSMLDMGGYGCGARWHLDIAVKNNDLALAAWLLEHGANPNAAPARDKRFLQQTLYEEAMQRGYRELAELLARHGAETRHARVAPDDAFQVACFRLDRAEAERLKRARPEYLLAPGPLMLAAERDRADVAELLLDLGMSPDVADRRHGNQRPLHVCGYSGSPQVAKLLIERGADVDAQESDYGATPLGFAIWSEKPQMIQLLGPLTRHVWHLAFLGNVEPLRDVLAAQPDLAKATLPNGETLLMRLPEDEEKAVEVVQLLLAHGADPNARNGQGMTAAQLALRRGLNDAAKLLGGAHGEHRRPGSD